MKTTPRRNLPQRVYIGPSRPFGLPLMQGCILRGEPEAVFPQIAEHVAAHPEMKSLFVTVDALASARREVKENGSALYQAFQNIKKADDAHRAAQGR